MTISKFNKSRLNSKRIKIHAALSLIFIVQITYGQTIIRSSINCFGSSYISGSLLVRQTTGQPSNTESFTNGQQLRQGFQQPIANTPQTVRKSNITVKLFPNPAKVDTKLTISQSIGEYEIFVSDITGRRITIIRTNNPETNIDCTKFPVGICIITVVKNDEQLAASKLVILK